MKFSQATSLVALGLAGTAAADWEEWTSTTTKPVDPKTTTTTTWADWDPTTSTTKSVKPATTTTTTWADWDPTTTTTKSVKPTTTKTTTWGDWDPTTTTTKSVKPTTTATTHWDDWEAASTSVKAAAGTPKKVTITLTETAKTTVTAFADTTTIYDSPKSCAAGAPVSPASAAKGDGYVSPASAAKGDGYVSPASSAKDSPVSPASATSYAAGSWPGSPVTSAGSSSPSKGFPDIDDLIDSVASLVPNVPGGKIHGENDDAGWEFDPVTKTITSDIAVPTYSGWGDWSGNGTSGNGTGPEWGSEASNVTKPFAPLKEPGHNGPSNRGKWLPGFDIDTDTAKKVPEGKACNYNWEITNTTLNYDGLDRLALAINGQVPGPAIECNWGDILTVNVKNSLKDNTTTIHWHGITHIGGTNDQDGVPGISECAIAPGSSRTYSFKLKQFGTGWYHSHVLSQYGDGIRGPMIIHGPATANYDVDAGTVMIDDLFGTATKPATIAEMNDRIAHFGPGPTWNYILNGANTSPDLSKGKHALWQVEKGKKYLFRIINSASQNMYSVHFDNHKMQVLAADYVPIRPYTTEWLNIGIGQRYDVVVEMNQASAGYFLRAVTQTGCPSGCVNTGLGQANGIILYKGAAATLPVSDTGNKTVADFAFCADEPLAKLKPWVAKDGGDSVKFTNSVSTLPAGAVANVSTADDGFVFRWFINNGAMNIDYTQPTLQTLNSGASANSSLISNGIVLEKKGEWYYFVIQNQFFASHPMHIHGHDMSVLGQGTTAWNPSLASTLEFGNPMRRDTAMLTGSRGPGAPPGYTVIGFQTDNPGAWLMHCHIIWHVDGGLALQWIERPAEVPQYANKGAFQSECSSAKAYLSQPGRTKASWESGLKRSTSYFEDMLAARSEDVVRHSETSEKRYIENYVRRGLGDGYKPRHGARK